MRGTLSKEVIRLIQRASWPNLRVLDLSNVGLGDARMEAFLPHLGRELRVLRLSHNFLSTKTLSKIFARPLSRLEELDLSFSALGSMGWQIRIPPSVRTLTLVSTQLNPRTLPQVKFPEHLLKLDLTGNALGTEGITAILPHLNPTMKSLGLKNTNLTHEGMEALAHSTVIRSIDDLNLSLNALRNEDAFALSKAPFKVSRLRIESNLIGNAGCVAVAKRFLPDLRTLFLSSNPISEECSKALASFMNPHLEELGLAGVPNLDFSRLAPKLPSTLRFLDLRKNYLSDGEFESLAPFLPSGLKTLSVSHCASTSKGMWFLAKALPPGLTELNIESCPIDSAGLLALSQGFPPGIHTLSFGPVRATAKILEEWETKLSKTLSELRLMGITAEEGSLADFWSRLPTSTLLILAATHFNSREAESFARRRSGDLSELYLSGCSFDGPLRTVFKFLPRTLEKLALIGTPIWKGDLEDITLKPLPVLGQIDFAESGIESNELSAFFMAHPSLYNANLIGNPGINDLFADQLDPIALENLWGIGLNGSGMTARGWTTLLQKFQKNLMLLALANSKLTEREVGDLLKVFPRTLFFLNSRGLPIGESGKKRIRKFLEHTEQETGRQTIYLE